MPLPNGNGGPSPMPPQPMPPPQTGPLGLQAPPAAPQMLHYDLKKGRYGVTVTVGKSSRSKLEQGQTEIGDIMQSDPSLVPLIGPIYFRYRDGPGMKEIGKVLQKQRDHAYPWLSDEPQQVPDPHQLMAENQQLKQQLQQAGMVIHTKQVEGQNKIAVTQIQEQAETQRDQAANETKIAVAELGAKVDRLALFLEERARLGVQQNDNQQAAMDRAHDVGLAGMQGQQSAAQSGQDHSEALQQGQQQADNALVQQAAAPQPQPEPPQGA